MDEAGTHQTKTVVNNTSTWKSQGEERKDTTVAFYWNPHQLLPVPGSRLFLFVWIFLHRKTIPWRYFAETKEKWNGSTVKLITYSFLHSQACIPRGASLTVSVRKQSPLAAQLLWIMRRVLLNRQKWCFCYKIILRVGFFFSTKSTKIIARKVCQTLFFWMGNN